LADPDGVWRLPISVYLCDDHAMLRAGLRALLNSVRGIDVIGDAGDAETATSGRRRAVPTSRFSTSSCLALMTSRPRAASGGARRMCAS